VPAHFVLSLLSKSGFNDSFLRLRRLRHRPKCSMYNSTPALSAEPKTKFRAKIKTIIFIIQQLGQLALGLVLTL